MGGNEKKAAANGGELLARPPWQNKKQREGLALLIATALHVRGVNLNELAAALPRKAERLDMRYQWISRVLGNDLIDVDEAMAPFAREVLAGAAAGGRSIVAMPPGSSPKGARASSIQEYLADRWASGCSRGRQLLEEIKLRGYTGSQSNLERLLKKWRRAKRAASLSIAPSVTAPAETIVPAIVVAPPAPPLRAIDPATGWAISPIVGAARCIKPRGLLTARQAARVAALKNVSPDFVVMRALAIRFRVILRGKDAKRLDEWLDDAQRSGIYAMQRFARTLRHDIAAVQNAVEEPWSNGQTEGQINRLKTLKRSMYGRAGAELLRARMMPISAFAEHEK